MALHFPKISIKNAVKRSCALLSALCIALYSLITAPLFGVHAVDGLDDVSNLWDWIKLGLSTSLSILGAQDGGTIPALVGNTLLSVGDIIVSDSIQDGEQILNSYVDTSTVIGISGFATYKGDTITVSSKSGTGGRFDNEDPYYNHWLRLFQSDDFAVDVSIEIPDSATSVTQVAYGYNFDLGSTSNACRFYFDLYSGSGFAYASNVKLYTRYFYDGLSKFYTETSVVSTSSSNYWWNVYYRNGSYPVYDDVGSLGLSSARYDHDVYIASTGDAFPASVMVSPTSTYHFPSDITNLTVDNVRNYYSTYLYPSTVRQFPVWQVLPEPPAQIVVPTDPTEPNTGTTGGVIIIDPFTLPPEWLEDNAELGTSHYELDSEQWEDPLEIIKAYKHADPSGQIPSGAVSDDGSFEGPADVVEAMEAFTDYAYMILTESGLLWVVASLVSVGLIVRLFTLK